MEMDKIKAIVEMKEPRNIKECQQLLGMVGYYRRFCEGFAEIAAPIYRLLRRETEWCWGQEQQEAFNKFKTILTSKPVLQHPDFSRKFILHTDASGVALGAILAQKDDQNREYVVAYASRLLKDAEIHYTITEKECLGIVWAIKYFRVYLEGTEFTVVTDHHALKWLMSQKNPTGRLARWCFCLQSFTFDIVHRKGIHHCNVDALSRPILTVCTVEDVSLKNCDQYEDEVLMYFLKYNKFKPGTPKKQQKRIFLIKDNYKLIDNKLYFRRSIDDEYFLIPKPEERDGIILETHLLGHFQNQATFEQLKMKKYYWKRMEKDVKRVVGKCEVCHRNEVRAEKTHGALSIRVTNLFEMVGIDLIFGLPTTSEGFNGILVITEYLSKYPWAVPIRSKAAQEIADRFFEYISIFGPPKSLLSDQGKEFLNEVVDNLANVTGVERRITSPYHPQTNGLTERFNQTLVGALRKFAENETSQWASWIPFILMSYRTKVHSRTKFTPFELMFGQNMNAFEKWRVDDVNSEEASIEKRAIEIRRLIENREKAIENNDKAKENQVREQNESNMNNIEIEVLPIGTQVYVKSMGILGKLEPKYHGPYTVSGYTRHKNYWLKNKLGLDIKQSVPRSRLKTIIANHEVIKIDKILDHRTRKGITEYLIKWSDEDENNCWLTANDFDSDELIKAYEKSSPPKTKRKKRGRPSKKSPPIASMIVALIISLIPISLADNIRIKDNFHFCENHSNDKLVKLDKICGNGDTDIKSFVPDPKKSLEIHILSKEGNLVEGFGYECFRRKIFVKAEETWTFSKRSWIEKYPEELSRKDCLDMVSTNKCYEKEMICEEGICSYKSVPEPVFSYASTNTQQGVECTYLKRRIVASSKQEEVFGTRCKVIDLKCKKKDSIIVWEEDIIRRCPLYYVATHKVKRFTSDMYFLENLTFEKSREVSLCGKKVIETYEGLFLTLEKTFAKSLLHKNMTIDIKLDYFLADLDNAEKKIEKEFYVVANLICANTQMLLSVFSLQTNRYLIIKDLKGKEIILYAGKKNIYAPLCAEIHEIVIEKEYKNCYEDVPIKFEHEGIWSTGYLTRDKIIKTTSTLAHCGLDAQYIFFNKEKVLRITGRKIELIDESSVDIANFHLYNTNTNLNLRHDKVLFEHVDVLQEVNELISIPEKVGIYKVINDKHLEHRREIDTTIDTIKSWFETRLGVILIITISSIVVIFIVIIACIVCRAHEKIRTCVRKKTNRNNNDEIIEVTPLQTKRSNEERETNLNILEKAVNLSKRIEQVEEIISSTRSSKLEERSPVA